MELPDNRQATPRTRRGRPTKEESTAAGDYIPAETVELPPVQGLVCPCCGRASVPRILSTSNLQRLLLCKLCGRRFKAIYSDDSKPIMVRRLPE